MQDMKHKLNEETLNRIIAAAYKDAGIIERIKIHFLIKKNPEAKKIFNEYRYTAKIIKNIPLEELPERVIDSAKTGMNKERNSFVLKPAYIIAAASIIITLFAAVIMFQNQKEEPAYTKAEIELAEEQVKVSLAIVNKIFKKTENLIQDEVMPKRVGKPIHKSLTIINDVLIGG